MLKVTTSSTNALYVLQIEYNFRWLQHPLQNLKETGLEKDNTYKPLSALNVGTLQDMYYNCVNCEWPRSENVSPLQAMVNFNHISLLTHPVCKKYLEMKWWAMNLHFLMSRDPDLKSVLFYRSAYGIKAHLLNMTAYAMGVFPLTYLIVNLKPTLVTARNVTSVNMVCTSLYKVQYTKAIHQHI